MAFTTDQWLRDDSGRNTRHVLFPVRLEACVVDASESKRPKDEQEALRIELWLRENTSYQRIYLTSKDVNDLMPYFLAKANIDFVLQHAIKTIAESTDTEVFAFLEKVFTERASLPHKNVIARDRKANASSGSTDNR